MARVTRRTLRHWANSTNFMSCQNVSGTDAKEEFRKMLKEKFPDYKEINPWDTFRDVPDSYNCDKLIVYGWYWRGAWSDPTKEVYARLYRTRC